MAYGTVEVTGARGDLPAGALLEMFGRLVLAASDRVTRDHIGVEQASAEVTSVFLHGVLAPPARG